MLLELSKLLDSVPSISPEYSDYTRAIENDNCLGKRSIRTRTLSKRHLSDLYTLDPSTTLFRNLRFFWQRDSAGRAMLACLCAYARDPLLRASASFVLKMPEGQLFSREALGEFLEEAYPGRFSRATLSSTTRNIASSWTQTGHLSGHVNKVRSKATATVGSTAYALFIGFLTGERGEALFKTDYARLLDCPFEKAVEYAETASRKGWIVFKRAGKVIEVLFPNLLTELEMGWIREQG